MCVIIKLKPNQDIPYTDFANATYNNPHGYGVVVRDSGRMQVFKDCPEGGNDPEVIYKILQDNKDLERIVHLRWNTAGETSLDNTQPFDVLSSKALGDFVFMHNGTLNSYKPTQSNGVNYVSYNNIPNDTRSDTKCFVEEFLTPLLASWKGDVEDPFFKKVIQGHWETSSKGLLISSKGLTLDLGSWCTLKDGDEKDIQVSNLQYFNTVTRGPEKERLDIEKKRKEEEEQKKRSEGLQKAGTSVVVTGTRFGRHTPEFNSPNAITFKDVFEDVDLYDPEGIAALDSLTVAEIKSLYDDEDTMMAMFAYVVREFKDLLAENTTLKSNVKSLEKKKAGAEQVIIDLKKGA